MLVPQILKLNLGLASFLLSPCLTLISALVARSEALRRRFVERRSWEDSAPLLRDFACWPLPPSAAGATLSGFSASRIFLSALRAQDRGALAGSRHNPHFGHLALGLAYALSHSANGLALASAEIHFSSPAPPSLTGNWGSGLLA